MLGLHSTNHDHSLTHLAVWAPKRMGGRPTPHPQRATRSAPDSNAVTEIRHLFTLVFDCINIIVGLHSCYMLPNSGDPKSESRCLLIEKRVVQHATSRLESVPLLKQFLKQQQSSSSSSNRFIEHGVSTRKLGPSSGISPSFLNRPIYTFMLAAMSDSIKRLLEDEELCC